MGRYLFLWLKRPTYQTKPSQVASHCTQDDGDPLWCPIAHLGYFRKEIIEHHKWLDEQNYADLLAQYQFLPSPSSSQMGIALRMTRAGIFGELAAWLGFTLPSAIALTVFAYIPEGVHGIKNRQTA